MIGRLLSRLFDLAGTGTIGLAVVTFTAMLGLLGYVVLNWDSPAALAKKEVTRGAGTQLPPGHPPIAPVNPDAALAASAGPTPEPKSAEDPAPAVDDPSLLLAAGVTSGPAVAPDSGDPTESLVPASVVVRQDTAPPEGARALGSSAGSAGETPAIAHSVEGREQCTLCHAVGAPGAGEMGGSGLPASHEGRSDVLCRACHTRVEAPPEPPPAPAPAIEAPAMLHAASGMEGCIACHAVGGAGAGAPGGTGLSSSHQGRGDSVCQACHTKVQIPTASFAPIDSAPAIRHSTAGMEGCTRCHSVGGSGLPSDHQGRTDSICRVCHTRVEIPPTSTPVPITNAPAIRHSTGGMEGCSSCHSVGGPGVGSTGGTGLPDDHEGRGDSTCRNCHVRVQIPPTPTPGPSATPAPGSRAPAMTHTAQGREACSGCHTVGGPGVGSAGGTGLPPSHQGRTDASCRSCHAGATAGPSPTGTATPASTSAPAVRHTTSGVTLCLPCHKVGGSGVGAKGGTGMTSTHQGRTDAICLSCHASGSSVLVDDGERIEHGLQGRTDCTSCHQSGAKSSANRKPTPKDHQGRPSGICLACHRA